jgi:hypothetical protein
MCGARSMHACLGRCVVTEWGVLVSHGPVSHQGGGHGAAAGEALHLCSSGPKPQRREHTRTGAAEVLAVQEADVQRAKKVRKPAAPTAWRHINNQTPPHLTECA